MTTSACRCRRRAGRPSAGRRPASPRRSAPACCSKVSGSAPYLSWLARSSALALGEAAGDLRTGREHALDLRGRDRSCCRARPPTLLPPGRCGVSGDVVLPDGVSAVHFAWPLPLKSSETDPLRAGRGRRDRGRADDLGALEIALAPAGTSSAPSAGRTEVDDVGRLVQAGAGRRSCGAAGQLLRSRRRPARHCFGSTPAGGRRRAAARRRRAAPASRPGRSPPARSRPARARGSGPARSPAAWPTRTAAPRPTRTPRRGRRAGRAGRAGLAAPVGGGRRGGRASLEHLAATAAARPGRPT